MKVVYTYCNIQKKPLSKFFLDMARLSVGTLRKFTNCEIELYTDIHDLDGLDFDKIHYIDFFDWDWDKRYWNIPKFKTYSMQEEPFIHVDFDLHIMPYFKIEETDIICEKVRVVADYENANRHCKDATHAICSGIMGTGTQNGIEYFKHLYEYAKEECKAGKWDKVEFNDLYSIEECYTYNYAIKNNLSVSFPGLWLYQHFTGENKEHSFKHAVEQELKAFNL